MKDSSAPFTADHAFVLQLQESRDHRRPRHAGRVEHLSSGQAARFGSEEELLSFVDDTLRRSAAEATER